MSQKSLRLRFRSETIRNLSAPLGAAQPVVLGLRSPEMGRVDGGILWSTFWCNDAIPKIGETVSKISSGVISAGGGASVSASMTTETSAISAGASGVASAAASASSGAELSAAISKLISTITG